MSQKDIVRMITVAAWLLILFFAYATLTRVGFVYAIYFKLAPFLRGPDMRTYAHFEHILGFAILGVLFSFAYPKRTILVCCIVFGGATLLEILQTLTPDRHGTLADALEKLAGGAVGILIAKAMQQFWLERASKAAQQGVKSISDPVR